MSGRESFELVANSRSLSSTRSSLKESWGTKTRWVMEEENKRELAYFIDDLRFGVFCGAATTSVMVSPSAPISVVASLSPIMPPISSTSIIPEEYPMLSIEECLHRIDQQLDPLRQELCTRVNSVPCESLDIPSALGRILAAEVRADRSVPQRPTSIMDGFAVLPVENSHESVHLDEAVPYRQLHVASSVTAGHGVAHVEGFLNASYVTTGTQLGSGDYAVVKIEDCEISGDLVRVPVEGVRAGLNIRQVGSDMEQGTIVASRGASITPTLLALLRDVAHEVELMPVLKVAVVSSGDELFSGETVDTNGPMLEGLLSERFGAAVEIERAPPLEDDFDKERESLLALAASCDVVISTGAVSKGSKDFIKKILDQEGKLHFGEVCLKPGKPTTFATLGDTPFFALPGNPASAYVTFHVFVAPFLEASLTGRQTRGDITVTLAEEFHQTDSVRPELVRASVSATGEGRLVARGVSGGSCQRSSRLFSCVDVNALVKLPAGAGKVPRGTRVPCILTGPIEPSVGEEAEVASRSELEAEAFAFRKLVAWLQDRTDVQNIDLMNLAGFCRNCLSKWYAEGASVELEDARERIYGMPYAEWKRRYQTPATEEAKAKFTQVHNGDNRARTACGHATGPSIHRHDQHARSQSGVSIGIVTCSDRASQGVYKDEAGALVAKLCGSPAAPVVVVPDNIGAIQTAISDLQSRIGCQLIITTGGTGFSERDVTPEAVSAMIAKRATGLEHMLLSCGRDRSKSGMFTFLSRPVAGVLREQPACVVVTLPGSPRAVQEILGNEELVAVLTEAARMASTKAA